MSNVMTDLEKAIAEKAEALRKAEQQRDLPETLARELEELEQQRAIEEDRKRQAQALAHWLTVVKPADQAATEALKQRRENLLAKGSALLAELSSFLAEAKGYETDAIERLEQLTGDAYVGAMLEGKDTVDVTAIVSELILGEEFQPILDLLLYLSNQEYIIFRMRHRVNEALSLTYQDVTQALHRLNLNLPPAESRIVAWASSETA